MTGIKPRTARVTIFQGDDIARLSDLDDAVKRAADAVTAAEKAAKNAPPRLLHEVGPEGAVVDAVAAHEAAKAERDAFAVEAEARGVDVVMHARPRGRWRTLMDEHRPRPHEEHPEDYQIGPCNIASLPDVLIPESICRDDACPVCKEPDARRTTIEGDTGLFLESLSDYDYYDRLFMTAFALNRGSAMADPTLRLGSSPSQT